MSVILQVLYSTDGAAIGAYLSGCEGTKLDFTFDQDSAKQFTSAQDAQEFITANAPLWTYRFRAWRNT